MPHTSSAKKRLRQYEKRRLRNRATKKAIKTQIKKLKDLLAEGAPEQIRAELNLLAKKLDKAAARRIVHPNLAARNKSQMARLVQAKIGTPSK
jgi:small subunit ribosomal protein S20